MKLKILIAFCLLLMSSCSSKPIIGTYYYKSEYTYHKLTINKDSTFIYYWAGDVGLGKSTNGKWHYSKPFLFINSDDSFRVFKASQTDSTILKRETIGLVDISEKDDDIIASLSFDGDTTRYYFKNNIILVPETFKNYKSFVFEIYGLRYKYFKTNPIYNFTKISFDSEASSYKWSVDDTLVYKKGKLHSSDIVIFKKK